MKKKTLSILLATIMVMALFGACTPGATAPTPTAPTPGTPAEGNAATPDTAAGDTVDLVGATVVMQVGMNWWDSMGWQVDAWSERLAASDRGFTLDNFYLGPTSRDGALQVQVISDAIALNPDILYIVPITADAVDAQIAIARNNGAVVVTHQGPALENNHFNIEGFRASDFGAFFADQMVYHGGPTGTVAITVATLGDQFHVDIANAMYDRFASHHPGWQSITGRNWVEIINAETAYSVVVQLIQAHPDINAIWCPSASAFPSVSRAVEELGRTGEIQLYALASPQLAEDGWRAGTVTLTAFSFPGYVAEAAYEVALRVIEGREINTGDDLGVRGFNSIIVDGRNIFGDGWLEITPDNWEQMLNDFPV